LGLTHNLALNVTLPGVEFETIEFLSIGTILK